MKNAWKDAVETVKKPANLLVNKIKEEHARRRNTRTMETTEETSKMKNAWKNVMETVKKPAKLLVSKIKEEHARRRKTSTMETTEETSVESSIPADGGEEQDEVIAVSTDDSPVDPEGLLLFNKIEKGKVARSENYILHIKLGGIKYQSQMLFLTSKRLLIVTEEGKIVWKKKWKEIKGFPKLHLWSFHTSDQLFIDYTKSKTVFHIQWNNIIKRLSFTRQKFGKVIPIQKDQENVTNYFRGKDRLVDYSPSASSI